MARHRLRGLHPVLAAGALLATALGLGTTSSAASPRQRSLLGYRSDIFVMNTDGSGRTNLTNSRADEFNLVWSPDGRRIAFDRAGPGRGNEDVFVIGTDGSGLRNITNTHSEWDESPTWSPDGTMIAFASQSLVRDDIFIVGADGGNPVNLTHTGASEFGPIWSPDGRRLAFGVGNDDYTTDVFVMNVDGAGRKNLTRNRGKGLEAYALGWSPDSTRLLVQRLAVGLGSPPSDLFVIKADGSGKVNLTPRPPRADDVAGVWSPDGTKIAFARDRGKTYFDIYVMNSDGTGKINLTNNPAYDFAPAWSPDGTKIAFGSTRGILKNREIMVMNADGSMQANLTRNPMEDSDPIWSPDGRRILFVGAPPQFCLVPKVVGLRLRAAQSVLSGANCSYGIREVRSSVPKERVLRQNPRPGTRLPYGGVVNLVVSKGPR